LLAGKAAKKSVEAAAGLAGSSSSKKFTAGAAAFFGSGTGDPPLGARMWRVAVLGGSSRS